MFEKLLKNKNQEPDKNKEKIFRLENIYKKGKTFLKHVRQASLAIMLIVSTHYHEIHKNRVEKISENGKEIFKHEDKETTHILNYISGAETLSLEERLKIVQMRTGPSYEKDGIKPPKDPILMTTKEFLEFAYYAEINFYAKKNPKYKDYFAKNKNDFVKNIIDYINEEIPEKYEYNDEFYKLLWETEKECGSPYIKWTVREDRKEGLLLSPFNLNVISFGVAHYSISNNTIYIDPIVNQWKRKNPINDIFAEWSHSKNFYDDYFETMIDGVKNTVSIAKDVVKSDTLTLDQVVKSQLKEYNKQGSLEYKAHSETEPKIREKFKNVNIPKPKYKKNEK